MLLHWLSKLIVIFGLIQGSLNFALASGEQCSSIFLLKSLPTSTKYEEPSASYPPKHLQLFYKAIGSWETPVPFHIGNVNALYKELAKEESVKGQLMSFEKGIDRGLQQIVFKEYSTSFIILKKERLTNKRDLQFTLKDSSGRWFTIIAKSSFLPKQYTFDFSTLKFIPSEKNDLNVYKKILHKTFADQRFEKMSVSQLGDYLTSLSLKTSTNAKKATGAEHAEFIKGISDGNNMLANLLVSKNPISETHLEQLNIFANQGINPYNWKTNAPMAGVIRGTSDKIIEIAGKKTKINMSQFEVSQTWRFAGDLSATRLNYFIPAVEVPGHVKSLLKQINELGSLSTPMEVFTLYKDFIQTHPFADGNGRTARMLLNFLLLKTELPPAEKPAASLFYRPEDALRKYIQNVEKEYGIKMIVNSPDAHEVNFAEMKSFKDVQDFAVLSKAIKENYQLSSLSIDHLHGSLAYLFVGVYRGRYIQFESTHQGELSDSLHVLISRSKELIDQQALMAQKSTKAAPTYAVYPELLKQVENYHEIYQENYLTKKFEQDFQRKPNETELIKIRIESQKEVRNILQRSAQSSSDHEYLARVMETHKISEHVNTAEEVANRIMTITASAYKQKVYDAMTTKASFEMKQSILDIYNAFNSKKFDQFMVSLAEDALALCRKTLECGLTQRDQIPEKYLAQVLMREADQTGVLLETISRYAGREPGRVFMQRIRRGSLLIDDGAPGNHGLMPHAIQNLFIYKEIGFERGKKFFGELNGWTYERMFDSNEAFTPIPATRDITRRHYWTGVFVAGNRSESSNLGSLMGEAGRYPEFLRKNQLELVEVQEIEQHLVNAGGIIKARYKNKEFEFHIDRDGVPAAESGAIVDQVKVEVDGRQN